MRVRVEVRVEGEGGGLGLRVRVRVRVNQIQNSSHEKSNGEANVAMLHLLLISSMLPFYLSSTPALPPPSPPRRHACGQRGERESDERAKEGGRTRNPFSLEI